MARPARNRFAEYVPHTREGFCPPEIRGLRLNAVDLTFLWLAARAAGQCLCADCVDGTETGWFPQVPSDVRCREKRKCICAIVWRGLSETQMRASEKPPYTSSPGR